MVKKKCKDCFLQKICEKVFEGCSEEETKARANQSFYHDSSIIWSVYKIIIDKICEVRDETAGH